jgi:hypothetical protein
MANVTRSRIMNTPRTTQAWQALDAAHHLHPFSDAPDSVTDQLEKDPLPFTEDILAVREPVVWSYVITCAYMYLDKSAVAVITICVPAANCRFVFVVKDLLPVVTDKLSVLVPNTLVVALSQRSFNFRI